MRVAIFVPFVHWPTHFGTDLELIQRHLDAGDEVTVLVCEAELPACDTNMSHNEDWCRTCIARRTKGLGLVAGHVNVIPLSRYTPSGVGAVPLRSQFSSTDELEAYTLDGFDLGKAALSSLVFHLRDAEPDLTAHATLLQSLLRTAQVVFLSTRAYLHSETVERMYAFNPRFVSTRGVLRACQEAGVECLVHDRGRDLHHYQLFPNTFPHDLTLAVGRIRGCWARAADDPGRDETAAQWYRDKAAGRDLYDHSFVLGQDQGRLPDGWDPGRRNIVVFTSSEDEYVGIGEEWRNPIYANELEGVRAVVQSLEASTREVHLYVRTHPNLARIENRQTRGLRDLRSPCLTVIAPESPVSTYALLQGAEKRDVVRIDSRHRGRLLGHSLDPRGHIVVSRLRGDVQSSHTRGDDVVALRSARREGRQSRLDVRLLHVLVWYRLRALPGERLRRWRVPRQRCLVLSAPRGARRSNVMRRETSRLPGSTKRIAIDRHVALASIALAGLATTLLALEAWASSAPAPSRWTGVALAAGALLLLPRAREGRLRWLALAVFVACAAIVNQAIVRLDSDLTTWEGAMLLVATIGAGVSVFLAFRVVWTSRGGIVAAQWLLMNVLLTACLGSTLDRLPGARMGFYPRSNAKGLIAHPVFGHWYPPSSIVRAFYPANPRGYFDGPTPMRRNWRLNLHSTRDSAVLEYPSESIPTIRVRVLRARSGIAYGIQLNEGGIRVRTGTRYLLRFRARADRPRGVNVGVAEWHPPWDWLGYYRTFEVDTAWSQFQDTVTVIRDDANARVHFDLATDSASVELGAIRFIDLSSGLEVSPDSMPFSLTARINSLGCRSGEVREGEPEGQRRVLVLGDSYVFGSGVRDEDTFGAQLERALNDNSIVPVSGHAPVTVMSCGVPGWGTRQEREFYQHISASFRADLVVVVMTWNDDRLRPGELLPPDSLASDTAVELRADRMTVELRALRDAVRGADSRMAVVVYRNAPGAEWQAVLSAASGARETGDPPMLDLWPTVGERLDWRTLVQDSRSDWHPNEVAQRASAQAVARFLDSHGLRP